jgi:hypothetical protein
MAGPADRAAAADRDDATGTGTTCEKSIPESESREAKGGRERRSWATGSAQREWSTQWCGMETKLWPRRRGADRKLGGRLAATAGDDSRWSGMAGTWDSVSVCSARRRRFERRGSEGKKGGERRVGKDGLCLESCRNLGESKWNFGPDTCCETHATGRPKIRFAVVRRLAQRSDRPIAVLRLTKEN